MTTTTIRLPEDLKERVAAAAERAGTTAHNFIVLAIAEKAEQAERQAEFQRVAEQRHAAIDAVFVLALRSQREAGYSHE